jgi:hypothetical protein
VEVGRIAETMVEGLTAVGVVEETAWEGGHEEKKDEKRSETEGGHERKPCALLVEGEEIVRIVEACGEERNVCERLAQFVEFVVACVARYADVRQTFAEIGEKVEKTKEIDDGKVVQEMEARRRKKKEDVRGPVRAGLDL